MSKSLFAHVLPGKGLEHDWPAQQLLENLRSLAYKRIVLRCDQEPAIMALVERVRQWCDDIDIITETAPTADKNANGAAERAVQAAEGQARTLKLELERRIGGRIPAQHPIVAWLVRHAADVVTKYEVKDHGKTAYEYVPGRPYRGEVADLGRQVLYRIPLPRGGYAAKMARGDLARQSHQERCTYYRHPLRQDFLRFGHSPGTSQ